MGRLIATLATLLVLLLGAAFVAPAFVDWKAYRPSIEQAASALLGRDIKIVGDIDVRLLPEPHLHAKKVVAEGGPADSAQLTAEAVDLSLSLQALLSGRVEASRLKLLNPFLILDLSKPIQSSGVPSKGNPLPIAAGVTSLEIVGGRVSVYPDAGRPEALILTGVDGTLLAPPPGNAYRFNGRVSQNSRRFDVKFLASPQRGGVKLAGSASDVASRTALQADGVLSAADAPVFEGTLALTAPQQAAPGGAPFEIQAKAGAKINAAGLALSDLVLTLDPQNRPQVLVGSADVAFTPGTANVALQARLLDADALLSAGASSGVTSGATPGWTNLRTSAEQLLWLFPDFGVHLSLIADQVNLRGELIGGVKLEGQRTGQKWLFEDAEATLPGETAIKLTGALKGAGGKLELMARTAVEGKNLARFNRWISPAVSNARGGPARTFSVSGVLTLSDDIAAFTDARGDVDGAPFTASLRLDKTSTPRLKLALSGDRFDLTSLETGASGSDAFSAENVKAAWRAGLGQISPLLGDDPANLDMADIDVSAGSIKTGITEARNVAIQLNFNHDLLSVTKLSAETADGLTIKGAGAVPLTGSGQGHFDGRIEALSAPAVSRFLGFAGFDADGFAGRRAEELAPALIAIAYGTDTQSGTATAQVSGNLGSARLDGRVQMKGSLAEWRTGRFSGQLALSNADGNKLFALLFPKAGVSAAVSNVPGTITIRASGTPDRLDTSASVKLAALQAQIDGAAGFNKGFSFTGKVQGSSQSPEQFLPPALLALLGGERQASLKIETNLEIAPEHFDASKLKAESPKNIVTGRLAIETAGPKLEVDADLKADQLSLPQVFGYLLTQSSADRLTAALSAAVPSQASDIWSDRPFSLNAFQDTAAKVMLAAKTMKLGDTLALSDARMSATLKDGRLDMQKLEGKALGGELSASLNLDAHASAVGASARITLSKADLSALPVSGSPALLTGKASVSIRASGQGLSPRGIISVLQGRGVIALSDGQLSKFSPAGVQKAAEELLAVQLPLTEDAIKKKALEAVQSADLKFRHLKIPLTFRDGMLEIRRASFRGRDSTVRMEAYLDLSSMQADTTWQAGVSSDRRMKWPPVKVAISGPVRELGGRPRVLSAEDFVRSVLVRKMEGDITRLERLNGPQAAAPSWGTKQEAGPRQERRKREQEQPPAAQAGAAAGGMTDFEKRMRDALSKSSIHPEPQ